MSLTPLPMAKPLLTLVIPALNEETNLPDLFERVTRVTHSLKDFVFEFLIIDNSSKDRTEQLALEFTQKDPRWRYIRFSRNFGFDTSLTAGLKYAEGAAVIFLPSDLQDPPEYITAMIQKWRATNADVVFGVVENRHDKSFLRSLGAWIAYKLIYHLSDFKIPPNATDFRLIARPVIEALNLCEERARYVRGLVHWMGFNQVPFPYNRAPRTAGKSSAGFGYCFNLSTIALVTFSTKPLRWASILGLISTGLSVAGAVVYTLIRILTSFGLTNIPAPPPGWATQTLIIFFFGGIQCLFMGIMGEYIGKIFDDVKQRPLWVISRTAGFPHQSNPLSTRLRDGAVQAR